MVTRPTERENFLVSRERFRDALCLGVSSWHSYIEDIVSLIFTNFIALTYLSQLRLLQHGFLR